MNQFLSIQIGDLIGFSHRGDWTTGEVVEIDPQHPVHDPADHAEFCQAFTVRTDSGETVTVPQIADQPPF
jgi:hypothetical protein